MRIAIVSPMVVGYRKSPVTYSSQQINLALRWAESGHQVDLITLPGQGLEMVSLSSGISLRYCRGTVVGKLGLPLM